MIKNFKGNDPVIGKNSWVAESADLIGNIIIGEDTSIWYSTVIRADLAEVKVGDRCSVQDGTVIHVDKNIPTLIGDDVTIGHKAILHGCKVGSGSLIGMGATLLDGAEIGKESIVAAGAVVTPGKKFPPRSMIMGMPAKVVRTLSDEDAQGLRQHAQGYVALKDEYLKAEK